MTEAAKSSGRPLYVSALAASLLTLVILLVLALSPHSSSLTRYDVQRFETDEPPGAQRR